MKNRISTWTTRSRRANRWRTQLDPVAGPSGRLVSLFTPSIRRRRVTFRIAGRKIEVRGNPKLILNLLAKFARSEDIDSVTNSYPCRRRREVVEVIDGLCRAGVLIPPERLVEHMSEFSSNSSPFMSRVVSEADIAAIEAMPRFRPAIAGARHEGGAGSAPVLYGLVKKRASFLGGARQGTQPSMATLALIMRMAYGNVTPDQKTVPSAGALYPLTMYVVTPSTASARSRRILWYDDQRDCLLQQDDQPTSFFTDWFLTPSLADSWIEDRASVIVVCVDWSRISKKYGPRGFRYAYIEVGCACQNAYLAAAEAGISVRAFGGFIDQVVATGLRLGPGCEPALAILVNGYTS